MNVLSHLRHHNRSLFSVVLSCAVLVCLVISCMQMAPMLEAVSDTGSNAMHMDSSPMGHSCCETDSSHCPLEIPLNSLFTALDTPQFFPLLWLLPLAASLLAIFQLRQRLYLRSPLSAWRSYQPGYPRLHVQQAVFLN